jgi:hypothetical protein
MALHPGGIRTWLSVPEADVMPRRQGNRRLILKSKSRKKIQK